MNKNKKIREREKAYNLIIHIQPFIFIFFHIANFSSLLLFESLSSTLPCHSVAEEITKYSFPLFPLVSFPFHPLFPVTPLQKRSPNLSGSGHKVGVRTLVGRPLGAETVKGPQGREGGWLAGWRDGDREAGREGRKEVGELCRSR